MKLGCHDGFAKLLIGGLAWTVEDDFLGRIPMFSKIPNRWDVPSPDCWVYEKHPMTVLAVKSEQDLLWFHVLLTDREGKLRKAWVQGQRVTFTPPVQTEEDP